VGGSTTKKGIISNMSLAEIVHPFRLEKARKMLENAGYEVCEKMISMEKTYIAFNAMYSPQKLT